jgi:PDZ domain-containing protein
MKQYVISAVIIALVLFLCPTASNGIHQNQPIAEIHFESVRGGMAFFPATVNSAGPFQFLLDTGGGGSHVDRGIANKLQVKLERGSASVSGSANLEVGVIPDATIGVGKIQSRGQLIVSPLEPLEPILGHPFEGIIGGDLLQRYVVELDYDDKVMRFYEPSAFRYVGRGQSLPISFAQGIPFVNLELTLTNGKSLKGDFLIDSAGGGMAIHIHKQIAERDRLLDKVPTLEEKGHGIGGETNRRVMRGTLLSIGAYRLTRPIVAITEDTAGLRTNPNSMGLVGMEVLGQFNLTFDYSRERLHFEPNRNFPAPFVYDTTGLRLRAKGPSFSPPSVFGVRDSSPAKEAGIEPEDVILQIDGRDTSTLNLENVRELLKAPGKTHRLSLSRKGKRFEVSLKTRDLLE